MDMNATFDYVQDVISEQVMVTHVRNVNLMKVNTAYLLKAGEASYSDDDGMGDMGGMNPLGGGDGVEL